jgi:dolichol-phosphate mannosyltransferase
MPSRPLLSLVIPTYNGAAYIAANVRHVLRTLEVLQEPFEVLVVCDGSTDATAWRAAEDQDHRVQVLHYPQNRGKGHAICVGITHARGRLVGWLDADLDVSPKVIVAATRCFSGPTVDAAIGSKRHPESRVQYPLSRRFFSLVYQLLVRILLRVNVRDTQVGAKVFRREMLEVVAPLLLIKQYAFDLEVLAVGAEFGFDRIHELPVELDYRFTGTGINKRSVQRMFVDTLAIAYRIHIRHWYVRQFAAKQRERGDTPPQPERRIVTSSHSDAPAQLISSHR